MIQSVLYVSPLELCIHASMRLNVKVRNVCENGFTVSKVLVALNVGCNDTGTCYVAI